MAISNHERVGKALELLKEGLRPFVERERKQIWPEITRLAREDSKPQTQQARLFEQE